MTTMFVNMALANQRNCSNSNVEVMDRRPLQPPQPHQQPPQQQQLLQQEAGAVLPGFRFHPTDEELVSYYLRRKVMHRSPSVEVITQLNIYEFNPWDLPKMSAMKGEKEWYFFCPRDRKYRNSPRPNRVTGAGFWKATGTDRPIYSGDARHCIGLKKSLVFYTGRAAKSAKTDWMMHEFRMPSEDSTLGTVHSDSFAIHRDAWAVCRIFKKSSVAQRSTPLAHPCPVMPYQQIPVDATAPSFGIPGDCTANPDLEPDNSSQERSDTTSEELEVEGSVQLTTQDSLPSYNFSPRGYATAAAHVQQPQPQQLLLKQEQSTATWPTTVANSIEDLLQDTSSARSNVIHQRAHIQSEIYPLDMPAAIFIQDSPSMRGALEYGSCIINSSQSLPQFVGSNFDTNSRYLRESLNVSHLHGQSMNSICSPVGHRMSTNVDIFQSELTQQTPQQGHLPQFSFSTQPWE